MHSENCEEFEHGNCLDHVSCDLPQELRLPEYRTERVNETVEKFLNTTQLMNHPAIQQSSQPEQELALSLVWPDMDELDAELYFAGKVKLYELQEKFKPKQSLSENNKKLIFPEN